MTLREVLQIEIWNRRTTRKIFVVTGILIGILALASLSVYEIETRWLTTRERNAASAALKKIDMLQDFAALDDQEFEARSKEAEKAVDEAEKAASTGRDRQLASMVSMYCEETRSDRDEVEIVLKMWERHISDAGLRTQFGKKIDLTGTEIRSMTRLELHRILD